MGAEPVGGDGGHGTVDAELAGHVVGRRHHAAAFGRAAHDHRLADQFGPVPLLDGGVEGVHVDVQDHKLDQRPYSRMYSGGTASVSQTPFSDR